MDTPTSGATTRATRRTLGAGTQDIALRDARLREAITALLDHAQAAGAHTIVVEELNFADPTAREKGHGRRAKAFRAIVAGIPIAQFKTQWVRQTVRTTCG